ncbi:MAG: YIP1 family protein [Oscillospiraceae bacterium]|jgi:hypothetical protein|nr:YIP1 family protein [Oscillospiraceae bacterium]
MEVAQGVRYAFYVLVHPFDGFWCLKSEKRGTLKSAGVLMAALLLTMVIRLYGTGYLVGNVSPETVTVWLLLPLIIGIYLLYCLANWSLTTLMNGSGTFREISIANIYALLPVILVNIPLTLLSHILSGTELAIYTFISVAAVIWALFLLLAANMSIHDYSMTKSVITFVLTLLAMLFIIVLGLLFLNLLQQVFQFVKSVVREIAFRL